MMQLTAGVAFASYIDSVTGKQRRSCAEYVAAGLARAAELGATEELHRLSAVKELLSACLQESKTDRWVRECVVRGQKGRKGRCVCSGIHSK